MGGNPKKEARSGKRRVFKIKGARKIAFYVFVKKEPKCLKTQTFEEKGLIGVKKRRIFVLHVQQGEKGENVDD